jgi:hypothetical protein
VPSRITLSSAPRLVRTGGGPCSISPPPAQRPGGQAVALRWARGGVENPSGRRESGDQHARSTPAGRVSPRPPRPRPWAIAPRAPRSRRKLIAGAGREGPDAGWSQAVRLASPLPPNSSGRGRARRAPRPESPPHGRFGVWIRNAGSLRRGRPKAAAAASQS